MRQTPHSTGARILRAALLVAAIAALSLPAAVNAQAAAPDAPPAPICGNAAILDGPAEPPAGALVVPAGNNNGFGFNRPGATFWFAPGVHTLGDGVYSQIIAGEGATYVGAPGAIVDGQNLNLYAFTGTAAGVAIRHLTIRNFGRGLDNNNEGVVNHDSGDGWTVEHNTIRDNDGAGVFLGSGNVVRGNCLADNGQYGFSMFKPPVEGGSAIHDIVLDRNEVTGNNTDDWETHIDGCGCTGGGKFWDVAGARVTRNWVHDNRGTGLWADTNNIDFLFEGNAVEDNDGEGIWYEISYNATIRHNALRRNAWVSGRSNTGSPGAAIYLSESGGDARLASAVSGAPAIRIYGNAFEDNFSGVSIYENANRFCNSNGNTSKGYCTPFVSPTLIPEEGRDYEYPNPISTAHPCYTQVADEPFLSDCRWRSQNIEVYDNDFAFDDTTVPCAGTYCGAQALYATGADNMSWSPYTVAGVQDDVMFRNGNRFHDNRYTGDWRFAKGWGETIGFASWRAAPYGQDAGSTFDGDPGDPPDPDPDPDPDPEPEPEPEPANHLDADTATLEASTGQWHPWYSSAISRSSEQAHGGTHSLRVDVTAPYGWGVELANWPGFAAGHGVKRIGFWGRLGSGGAIAPKLTVKWLDADQQTLRTDAVALPELTSTAWERASALVDAPAGTSTVLAYLTGSGSAGTTLYLDDIVVSDAPNLLDPATAGGEGSVGRWVPWYASEVTASTEHAHRGTGSVRIGVTAPYGWGAQLSGWPGTPTAPGAKRISFWARQGTGAVSALTLRVKWFDEAGVLLDASAVPLEGLTAEWRQALAEVTAPPGTATAHVEAHGDSGTAGDSVHLDDVVIATG